MRVMTIPTSEAALESLRAICRELALPPPACLSYLDLPRTMREIVSQPLAAPRDDLVANSRLAGLRETVVVLANVPPALVQGLIRAYKARGEWPIIAVVTRQSLDMSLAVLLEHLGQDRGTEARLRTQRSVNQGEER